LNWADSTPETLVTRPNVTLVADTPGALAVLPPPPPLAAVVADPPDVPPVEAVVVDEAEWLLLPQPGAKAATAARAPPRTVILTRNDMLKTPQNHIAVLCALIPAAVLLPARLNHPGRGLDPAFVIVSDFASGVCIDRTSRLDRSSA
jgi:hypothetical protein